MLPQLLFSGLVHGALYALMALGMTAVYRATTVVNFGHGDLLMAGAFVVYVLVVLLRLPFVLAAPASVLALCLTGFAIERWFIRPILGGPHLSLAMMAIAVGYVLRGAATTVWGREILPFPQIYPNAVFMAGPVVVTSGDAVMIGSVAVLLAALAVLFVATPIGKTAQAVFQSQQGAALVGIDVGAFQGGVWGLGAGLAAVGGILIAPVTLLYPDMAASSLVRAFAAMTLGGFGSLPGAVIGAVLLGVAELLVGFYLDSQYVEITPYVLIILVLLIRPSGLFGRRAIVRV